MKPGFIRVDADEVSYPAHVILRYEIERALIDGEIEVDDIPSLWDEKMQHWLGLSTTGNYRDGCMQDIHWTDGGFGYFLPIPGRDVCRAVDGRGPPRAADIRSRY